MSSRYLLDTCTFLWLAFEPKKLSKRCTEIVADSRNELLIGSISVLEIAILNSLGRETGFDDLRTELPAVREAVDVEVLNHDEQAAITLAYLPLVHRDPFDRALIAQSISIGVPVLTPDEQFGKYPVQLVW